MPVEVQETLVSSIGWIALISALLLAGISALLHQILGRLRSLEERLGTLDRLPEIRAELARIGKSGGGSDLSHLEGVLVDLRDSQRRLAERLVQLAETATREHSGGERGADPGAATGPERIVNRLLSMGYDGVQIITSGEEVQAAFEQGGEVLVEARREGVACKGRLRVEGGRIREAELRSAHSMFP
jgi:hypothetical protein